MSPSREVINDLRAQARTLRCFGFDPVLRETLVRTLHRGADEIDRILGELDILRAYAEIPAEPKAPKTPEPIPASLVQRYRDYVGKWPEERS